MPNSCVFCGDDSRRLTDEHVFGDWISRYFVDELGVGVDGLAEIVDEYGAGVRFPMVPFQQKVKIACRACNTGWMSQIETDVKDDLSKMMIGQPKMMRANTQRKLALWCAKTALVLDHLHPQKRVVPESHYRELFDAQRTLKSQVVLVAFRSVPRGPSGELLASALKQPVSNVQVPTESSGSLVEEIKRNLADGRKMYKITFAVGNFVALVFGHDFSMPLNVNSPRPVARHIWPINQRFRWSADLSIDRLGGLPAFHAAFAPGEADGIPDNVPGQLKT